jgi:hypothetical protein
MATLRVHEAASTFGHRPKIESRDESSRTVEHRFKQNVAQRQKPPLSSAALIATRSTTPLLYSLALNSRQEIRAVEQ